MSTDPMTKPPADARSTSGAPPDPANALFSFWTQWMEQSTRGTQAILEAVQGGGDPQKVQKQWLDAVSRSLDDFMRTPVFLESMKKNLKAMTDMKVMQDQVLGGAAKNLGLPLAEDITGLYERVRGTEQAILTQLKAIDERLKSLESKIDNR